VGEFLLAVGRGLMKLVISILAGAGVGVLVLGLTTRGRPEIWHASVPTAELLIAIGAGSLTAAVLLLLLFGICWLRRRAPGPRDTGGPAVVTVAGEVPPPSNARGHDELPHRMA
jgi:hypothetical protein